MSHSESYRPLYHITPDAGWINDPNGLVHFNGEWHLFYQYYHPAEADSMQWGHAVSADLARWRRLPTAIPPDAHGQIWSGSAVVDHRDTSGFFGGRPGIVCIFTYWDPADHRQCQGLAYSPDGRTFHTYAGNPIIPQLRHLPGHPDDKDFRDPKVFWHAPTGRWVMAVAGGQLRIFTSANLREWRFEGVSDTIRTECPDLFEMPVDGDPARTKWVLSGGGRWYMLGAFDGRRFVPETEAIRFGGGPDFYATQTWNDAPGGRRVGISWIYGWNYESGPSAGTIRNPFPTERWSGGCLGVPCELALRSTPEGPRLVQQPVREIEALRRGPVLVRSSGEAPAAASHTPLPARETGTSVSVPATLAPASLWTIGGPDDHALDIELEFDPAAAATVGLRFPVGNAAHYAVGYRSATRSLFVDRRASGIAEPATFAVLHELPLAPRADGSVALRILLDGCSVEVFDSGGTALLSAFVLPGPAAGGAELYAEGGECQVRRLAAWAMDEAIGER